MRYKTFVLVSFLGLILSCSSPHPSYTEYTPIDTDYPVQNLIETSERIVLERNGNTYVLTPKAEYKIGAVVAAKKRYRDALSPLSPYDLALLWSVMTQPEYRKQVTIRQSKRRYWFFPKKRATVSNEWIYLHSSNHHIIPANDNIRKALSKVRKNDTVLLEGYLVNVWTNIGGNTTNWNTSLTRDDKGDGACEIIYVTRLKRKYDVYE